MKAFAIALVLAVTSISSVSSAVCMKKLLSNTLGLAPDSRTNAYYQNRGQGVSEAAAVAGNEQVNRQR